MSWLWPVFFLACMEEKEVRAERCTGPLNRLVKWRDEAEMARKFKGKEVSHTMMAAQELQHVEETVATLKEQPGCDAVWRVMLFQVPDTPATRLQEETILRLFGGTPHDYDTSTVGWALVTTSGRPPVDPPNPKGNP